MPSYDPTLFNVTPYYDDFEEDKKFLRMLFRPGYAVQSRELTQLQTILQNQIERFGDNIFKDGSRIIGGQISTQTLNFVRINPSSVGTQTVPSFPLGESDLVGFNLIQRNDSGAIVSKGKVVSFLPSYSPSDDYAIAVVSYMSGTEFSENTLVECDNPDKSFNVTTFAGSSTVPYKGRCKVVATGEGIYYVSGFFVKTTDAIKPAFSVSNDIRQFETPTGFMGLKIVPIIVTEKDDFTLKDPANGTYNYNAPGAHRYKIDLQLTFVDAQNPEDFVELVQYEAGIVVKKFDQTQYSELMKLFAQRTYDEKGNYIVKPFDISFRSSTSEDKVFADIGSGKAYVYGHEYESRFKESIEVPKARTASEYDGVDVGNYFGNYIVGKYSPQFSSTSILTLFSLPSNLRNEKSLSIDVYGATGPISASDFLENGFSNTLFSGILYRLDTDDPTVNTTQGGTMQFRAYLAGVQNIKFGQTTNSEINLYRIDPVTRISTKLLSNITKDSPNSAVPKFFDFSNQSLVYSLNGNTPTTMIKEVDSISYVHDVVRSFSVSNANPFPSIELGLGNEYNWCYQAGTSGKGNVPDGTDQVLTSEDGYYLVSESPTLPPTDPSYLAPGTVIKIVGPSAQIPSGQVAARAKISGSGDFIVIINQLPLGGYRLVGKAQALSTGLQDVSIGSGKIRVKEIATTSETITNLSNQSNVFKRTVLRNSSNSVFEMFFTLDRADILRIDSIILTGSNGENIDISDRFLFDSGQRDHVYMLGRLYVKPNYFDTYSDTASYQFTVNYSYFNHSGYGPLIRESYLGVSYDQIPVYTDPITGNSINLANAVDFRPLAKIIGFYSGSTTGSSTSSVVDQYNRPLINYSNGFVPVQSSLSNDHTAYLPRIDKIVISRNIAADGDITTLQRISGVASDSPVVPEDTGDSMTMYVLSIPAYTFNPSDIKADSIGNNRFTMKDIGTMSKRIDNLEQHAVLSDVELSILSKDITTSSGADAIKRAVLVDTFEGHSVADVVNLDHRCSIDVERGELRPSFDSHAYDLVYTTTSGLTLTSDNILCESYSRSVEPVISQDKASKAVRVNPFGLPNWVGNMKITPHADFWFDKSRPLIKNNDTGINDAWAISNMNSLDGHGSQWNDWESIWTGLSVELTDVESGKNSNFFSKSRKGSAPSASQSKWYDKDVVSRKLDSLDSLRNIYKADFRKRGYYTDVATDTIVNRSVVPHIRDNTVNFSAYNLKPNTQVHVFMDNMNMNQYCSGYGLTSGPFITDSIDGSLVGITMNIPAGMFDVGEKTIRVIDDSMNNIENATTIGEASFQCSGIRESDDLNIVSIRNPEIKKQTPNSNKVISTPLYRKKNLNTVKYNQWMDPLAQTFEVNEDVYPSGFYAESVDLYIATKDADLPITVQICPTINGLPHAAVVLPFSTVVKSPSEITADAERPVATTFKFSTPVFLAPGEYAVLVQTNSQKYTLFVANIGDIDIVTDERISSTFQKGSLFRSQNNSEISGESNTDLMFKLWRCSFTTNVTTFSLQVGITGDSLNDVTVVQPNLFLLTPSDVNVSSKVTLGPKTYDCINGRNIPLKELHNFTTQSNNTQMTFTLGKTEDSINTFMLDMDRSNLVAVEYIINSQGSETSGELMAVSGKYGRRKRNRPRRNVNYVSSTSTQDSTGNDFDDTARYISKYTTISGASTATELRVFLDVNIPSNSFIRVFAKTLDSSKLSKDIDSTPYQQMTIEESGDFYVGGRFTNSTSQYDFKEASFRLTPTNPFNIFLIKICLYTSNKTNIPVVKNLRTVAIV